MFKYLIIGGAGAAMFCAASIAVQAVPLGDIGEIPVTQSVAPRTIALIGGRSHVADRFGDVLGEQVAYFF